MQHLEIYAERDMFPHSRQRHQEAANVSVTKDPARATGSRSGAKDFHQPAGMADLKRSRAAVE